jgi:hypothetical protein
VDPAILSMVRDGGYLVALPIAVWVLWRSRESLFKYIMDTVSKLVTDYQSSVNQLTTALKTYDESNKLLTKKIEDALTEFYRKGGRND